MFNSGNLLRTIAQELTSQVALRNCSRKIKEEPGYVGVFAEKRKKKNVVEHQKITANQKKTRYLKLMILVPSYVWEDARVWAYWNYSVDTHLNYLGLVFCFSPSCILLRIHHRGKLQWLMAWRQTTFIVYWNGRQLFLSKHLYIFIRYSDMIQFKL